jgi:hypothetical protein
MLLLLLACTGPEASDPMPNKGREREEDSGIQDSQPVEELETDWTILVFMNGDNDLEHWVTHDLNELENGLFLAGKAGKGKLRVLVQADRTPGYDTTEGDWTGTRRYEIVADKDPLKTESELLEELGELNMGDPKTLEDFLAWGAEAAPATRTALVLWNHGTSWTVNGGTPPPGVSWDDTSAQELSVAEGELAEGLEAYVAAYGKLDLVAFDACNMASWEVAYALSPYAHAQAAAETTVGMNGLQYGPSLEVIGANPEISGHDLADIWAYNAVEIGLENTFAAIDLDRMEEVAAQLEAISSHALSDSAALDTLLIARENARGVEQHYEEAYLDLGNLAKHLEDESEWNNKAPGLKDAVDSAVIGAYGSTQFSWVNGLTIYFDPYMLDLYAKGSWSKVTHWDELLLEVEDRL